MKAETVPGVDGHGLLHDKPDLGSACGCSAGRWRSTPTCLRARSPRRRSSARRPHWPCRPGEGQGLAGSFGETGSFKILLDQTCDTISTGVHVQVYTRLLNIRHLHGIWSGLIPYRLRLDTLSEYPEP